MAFSAASPFRPDFESKESDGVVDYFEAQILPKPSNFASLISTGYITSAESAIIDEYLGQQGAEKADLLSDPRKGPLLVEVLVEKVLDRVSDDQIIGFVLSILHDALLVSPDSAKHLFAKEGKETTQGRYDPFNIFRRLYQQEFKDSKAVAYTVAKAAYIVANSFAGQKPANAEHTHLHLLIKWANVALASGRDHASSADGAEQSLLIALQVVRVISQNYDLHSAVIGEGTLQKLLALLSPRESNPQILYLAGYNLWVLSFSIMLDAGSKSVMIDELRSEQAVRKVVEVMRVVARERVIRILALFLKNLLEHARSEFADAMIGSHLLKLLSTLAQRKFKDEDVPKDIEQMTKILESMIKDLSSWDMYVKELNAGALQRTPVHTDLFFKDNISKITPNHIQQLVAMLDAKEDETVELACFDLGEIARWHPDGKKLISLKGGKVRLMELMQKSSNKDVAKGALLCVQKLLVSNWESFSKQQLRK